MEPLSVQTLLAESTVERFDDGVIRRLAPSIEIDFHVVALGPLGYQPLDNSDPLSQKIRFGNPRSYVKWFNVVTTSSARRLNPTSIPKHSQVNRSTIVNVLIRRPSAS
jgi:hypothetical protein